MKYPLDGDHLLLVNGAVRSVIFFVYSLRSLCGMTLHLAFHNVSIVCLNVILLYFREHACEVLFEQDNELQSISTIILDAIINVRFL